MEDEAETRATNGDFVSGNEPVYAYTDDNVRLTGIEVPRWQSWKNLSNFHE